MKGKRIDGRIARQSSFASLGVLASLLLLLFSPGPAQAHSELEDSTPAADARLSEAPSQIALVFNQDISPEFVTVALTVGDNTAEKLKARTNGPNVTADVPADAADETVGGGRVPWQVAYRVVSADGHPISGAINFTLAAAGAASPAAKTPSATISPRATPPAAKSDSSGQDETGSPVVATIIIGGLAAAVAVGAALWLIRARNRGTGE